MYRILLGFAVVLVACKSAPTTVLLRIEAEPTLGAPEHVMLDLYGSAGWEVRARRLPASGTVALPSEVVLYPPRASGTLRVLLRARQANGDVLGEGSGEVALRADDQARLTVTIRPGRLVDRDGDGVPDVIDNCPALANPEQGPCGVVDARVDGPRDGGRDGVDASDGPAVDGRPDGRADGPPDGPLVPDLRLDAPPLAPPPSQVVTSEGWGLRLPTFPRVHYNAVWGRAQDDVWIVGDEGMVLHYDGRQWQALPTGSNERMLAVWSPGAGEAWVAGENEKVWHYAGGAWTSTNLSGSGGNKGVAGIWGASPTDIWIVNGKDGAHHFGGAQWTAYPGQFPLEVADVKGLAANAIWAVGRNSNWGGIGYYDGTFWGQATPASSWDDLRAVWPVSGSEVWAAGRNGTIVRYDGAQWTRSRIPLAQDLNGIWAAGSGQVIAAGDVGQIWRRTQQGWVSTPSPTTARLNGVWGSSATDIWLVGENGTVLHDNGQHVVAPPTPPTTVQLEGAWWTPGGELVVVGGAGTVLRRSPLGVWSKDSTGTSNGLNALWGAPNGHLWVVGVGGVILFNDGTGWVSQASGSTHDLYAISGSGAADIWAVGGRCTTDPVTLITTCTGRATHYAGGPWASQSLGNKRLRGVWMDGPGDAWAVGEDGTLYRLAGSPSWSSVASPTKEDLYGVWGDGTTVWVVGDSGMVLEGGALGFSVRPTPATFDLAAVSGAGPRLWAVGRDGQALQRAASGSWSVALASPNRRYLRSVLALGPKDVWVVGQGGTVLHFDDR